MRPKSAAPFCLALCCVIIIFLLISIYTTRPGRPTNTKYGDCQDVARLGTYAHSINNTLPGYWKFDQIRGDLSMADIYVAVKTTYKNHRSRVQLQLDSWVPLAPNSVSRQ